MVDVKGSNATKARFHSTSRGVSAAVLVAFSAATFGFSGLALADKAPAATAAKKPPKDPKKEAGIHFKKGQDFFKKKDFKSAKPEFELAEELFPGAMPKYMIAQCAEELGLFEEAAGWFDKAAEMKKLKDDAQKDAETRSAALKAKPVKLKITSDPAGATISIDGKAIPDKAPATIDIAPGKHHIALTMDKRKPNEQDVDVASFKGAEVTVALEIIPEKTEDPFAKPPATTPVATTPVTPPPVTPPPDTRMRRDMTWVYVTGGAAIVGIGFGVGFGVKALSDKKDFDKAVTAGSHSGATDAHDRGTRNALISDMGFGVGVTLAITSLVLYFTSPTEMAGTPASAKSGSRPTMSFAPAFAPSTSRGPGFAGASASFTF